MPDALDSPLSIRAALNRKALADARHRAALARRLGRTETEVLAVQHLARAGELTPGQLATQLQLSSGGTTGVVHRLQRAGHITRGAHTLDRRSTVLRLTPAIEDSASEAWAPLVAELDALAQQLPGHTRDVVARFLEDVANAAERHADRLALDADAHAHDALAVPLPAVWASPANKLRMRVPSRRAGRRGIRLDGTVRRQGAVPAGTGHVGVESYDGAAMAVPARSIDDEPLLAYKTDAGEAWLGDAIETLDARLEDESVDLIVTSPPFALQRPKEYGNESQDAYKEWFLPFADEFWRVLKPTGSLVLDLGGAWEAGQPVKSIYQFELLVSLCRRPKRAFVLAQDFYWYNPARLPSPAQWVTVERVRVKDAVNYIWWLSKTPNPKADNTRVLREYTEAMKRLIDSGTYNRGRRPSGHVIREGFTEDRGGAIPPNLLTISNTGNDREYLDACKDRNLRAHPARFPAEIPDFFVNLLTEKDDLVVDPFAGSNVTGAVAESLGRRWLSIDIDDEYVRGSMARFEHLQMQLVEPRLASDA